MNGFIRSRRWGIHIIPLALALLFVIASERSGSPEERITLGAVEDVMVLPCRVTLPARVDTGAETTSLDARNLLIAGDEVAFCLPAAYGGTRLRMPVVRWARVKGASGRQERPVVRMDLCVGRKKMNIEVTLTERSAMKYPLLLGRNVLEKGFLVDVSRQRLTAPACD
jgi:hypothetical protein